MDANANKTSANANKPRANNFNAAVFAALDDVHALQERLARGDVSTRPPKHTAEATPSAEARRSPSPPRAVVNRRHHEQPRRREIMWVSKPLQRWRSDGSTAEALGTLEFLRGATLADARTLVDQFYPLPHKRAYVFYHPALRVPIDQSDEANVDPAVFDVLAIVAFHTPTTPAPASEAVEARKPKEKAASPQKQRETTSTSPIRQSPTAASAAGGKRSASAAIKSKLVDSRTPVPTQSQPVTPVALETTLSRRRLGDGVVCDIVIRDSVDGSASVVANVLEGEFAGRSTTAKMFTATTFNIIAPPKEGQAAGAETTRFNKLISGLSLASAKVAGNDELQLVYGGVRGKQPKRRQDDVERTFYETPEPIIHPANRESVLPHDDPPIAALVETVEPSARVQIHAAQVDPQFKISIVAHVDGVKDTSVRFKPHAALETPPPPKNESGIQSRLDDGVTIPSQVSSRRRVGTPKEFDSDAASSAIEEFVEPDVGETVETVGFVSEDEAGDLESKSATPEVPEPRDVDTTMGNEANAATTVSLVELAPLHQAHGTVAKGGAVMMSVTPPSSVREDDRKVRRRHEHKTADALVPSQPMREPSVAKSRVSVPVDPDPVVKIQRDRGGRIVSHPEERILAIAPDSPAKFENEFAEEEALKRSPPRQRFHPCEVYVQAAMDFLVDLYKTALTTDASSRSPYRQAGHQESVAGRSSSEVLISKTQYESTFRHYGIDHSVTALNGVLFGMEEELSAWSSDEWEEVQESLISYVTKELSQVTFTGSSDSFGTAQLQLFEAALNFVADVVGWTKLTMIRLEIIEKVGDASFQNLAEIGGRRAFRLSDNERSILSRIVSSISTESCTELERWLADGLEVLYFLVQKHFATIGDMKLQLLPSREQRIQWVIQKMVNLDPSEWRRMELFFYPTVEDFSSWVIVENRLRSFRRDHHLQRMLLDSDVFLPAFIRFLHKKAALVNLSISDVIANTSAETAASTIQRFVVLMKREIETRSWSSDSFNAFLRAFGLKVCELDSVNGQRQLNGLPRVNVSGRHSLHTAHQTRVLGSVYGLYKKPRWDQPDMMPPPAQNWYTFHGDTSIALEYVYVRHSIDLRSLGNRWEEELQLAEKEALNAFRQFPITSKSSKRSNVVCAIGLNVLHAQWLQEKIDFTSPAAVAAIHPQARSLSIGYHLSRNEDIAAIRITIRIHATEDEPTQVEKVDSFIPTQKAVMALNRFVCSASEEVLRAFVLFGGLRFLNQCLRSQRQEMWNSIPFGRHFSSTIRECGLSLDYSRADVVFFLQRLLLLVPRAESTITTYNLALLNEVVKFRGSPTEDKAAEVAVRAFILLASAGTKIGAIGHEEDASDHGPLKKFLAVDGLRYLKRAIDGLLESSGLRAQLEDALCTIIAMKTACALEGFFVHCDDWMKYFVQPEAWLRSAGHVKVLLLVLDRLHSTIFCTDFIERDQAYCGCGCRGHAPASLSAFSGMSNLFCSLLNTPYGRTWGSRRMQGPLDLLVAIEWAGKMPDGPSVLASKDGSSVSASKDIVCTTLDDFLQQAALGSETCLDACDLVVSRLLKLAASIPRMPTKILLMQLSGRLLDAAVKMSVWITAPCRFLNLLMTVLVPIVDIQQQWSLSAISAKMVLHEDRSLQVDFPDPTLLSQEHEATATSNNPTSSILQSIVILSRPSSRMEGYSALWRAPLLVGVTWLLSSARVAKILAEIGIESALHEIFVMENSVEDQVLSGRALAAFYLQARHGGFWKPSLTLSYSRIFSVVVSGIRSGAKKSLTRRQLSTHVGDAGEPLFGANLRDTAPVITWYKALMLEMEQERLESPRDVLLKRIEEFWIAHEWRDTQDLESLITHLKLLFVCSAVAPLIKSSHLYSEVAQVVLFVLKFVRDRSHVPQDQVVLFVSSLANLVSALGTDIQQMGFVSALDINFFERLLVYTRRSSPLLSRMASRALWALAIAFADRGVVFHALSSTVSLTDEDSSTSQKPLPASTGVDVLIGTILKKLGARTDVEGDAATLALALEYDSKCAHIFFSTNRFSTITKFLSDCKIELVGGSRSATKKEGNPGTRTDSLSYDLPTTRCERDMIQVGRLTHSCLLVLSRSDKASQRNDAHPPGAGLTRKLSIKLGDALNCTKTSIVPLLKDEHPLIVEVAVLCVLVHVKSDSERSIDLLESKELDHLLAVGLDCQAYGPLQAASLTAVRLFAGNVRTHEPPYGLLEKIFREKAKLIRCLLREDFEIAKQTVELLVLLLAKNDSPYQRSALASVFQEAGCQAALSSAFDSLCGESRSHRNSAGVLQRLVGFVIELGLVQLIDGDKMIEAMCLAITSHKGEIFLLPMICNCLCDIAVQQGNSIYFAKRSRLDAIVGLLSTSLTNGEARHIGATLRVIATEHSGIKRYLSQISSNCLVGVARVFGSFSRASAENVTGTVVSSHTLDEPTFDEIPPLQTPTTNFGLPEERHLLRVSLEDQVLVSVFTDEVYEEFLGFLVILLAPYESASERFGCTCSLKKRGCIACDPCDLFARAGGPRLVTRFLLARRIFVRLEDTNENMLEAAGSDPFTIVHLSLRTLQILSRSQRCRVDMLAGSKRRGRGWWSIMWLIERSQASAQQAPKLADIPLYSLMVLGHCAATNGVVDFILTQREFLVSLFTHLASACQDKQIMRCQRAVTFLLARLAEHAKIVRDLLFREKAASLLASLAHFEDRIVQANLLILARNLDYRLPNDELLQVVIAMLQSEAARDPGNWTVLRLVCDVLTHLLLVRSPSHEGSSRSAVFPRVPPQGRYSKDLIVSVRSAMAPAWRSLFASFEDEDDSSEYQMLIDEARNLITNLWPNGDQGEPVEALLDFLLRHHLPSSVLIDTGEHKIHSENADDIPRCDDTECLAQYHPSLQYLNSTAEQNTPHKPDNSFHGSVRLWRFVQLLWRVCTNSRIVRKQPNHQLPMDRMIGTLLLWARGDSSDSLSSLSLERRQRLLKFVNEILRSNPEHCKALRLQDIVSMLEVFASRSGSTGVGFELLLLMCRSEPSNAKHLVSLFAQRETNNHALTSTRASPGCSMRKSSLMYILWYAARAGYYVRAVPTSRVVRKSDDMGSALRVLEPYVSSPSTAFAMALLDTLSDSNPDVLIGYLQCQSVFVLLELMSLTISTKDAGSKSPHTLNASLLRLIRKTLEVEPNAIRFFRADPRLLLAVQRQAFSVKTATQLAAVELLGCLAKRDSSISDGLWRLEVWTNSISKVQPWMADAIGDHLARLRLVGMNRKEIVEVAHLVQVPLFACVKTVDMVRLSVAFMESRLPEEDTFMVLSGGGMFSSPLAWMCDSLQNDSRASNPFMQTVETQKLKGLPVLLYKMQKDWYVGGSSMQARQSITAEIASFEARVTSLLDHSTLLASRLARFLVEDRAELLRRVCHAKQLSPTDVAALLHPRGNDILSLLAASSLMSGVSRDSLACLAVALSEPTSVNLDGIQSGSDLLLVMSEGIDDEAHLVDEEDQTLVSVQRRLERGDLIGLPWWNSDDGMSVRLRLKAQVVAVDLPQALIRSELQPSEFKLVESRCRRDVWKHHETQEEFLQWIRFLAGRVTPAYSFDRRDLQLQSLCLTKTLMEDSTEYAMAIARNRRLVSVFFDVARSHLHPSLVDAAVDVLIEMSSRLGVKNGVSVPPAILTGSLSQTTGDAEFWLPFAIQLTQAAIDDARTLERPLRLLVKTLQASPKDTVAAAAPELLMVVDGAFTQVQSASQVEWVNVVSQVLSLLIEVSPRVVQIACRILRLPLHIFRLLANRPDCRPPALFCRLLQAVVFCNEDSETRQQLHDVFLEEASQLVIRVAASNLYVESRSKDDGDTTSVTSYLAFIGAYCEHVVQANARMQLLDPDASVDHVSSVLLLPARVVLDGFNRFVAVRSLVLHTIARVSAALLGCARLAANTKIRDRQRRISFHSWVLQRFRDLPSTHTGTISRGGDELLAVVSCICALARIARAARHFVNHGIIELAFRYLLHRPPDVLTDIHVSVWLSLIHTLSEIMRHLPTQNLLQTHADKLHSLHVRLVTVTNTIPSVGECPVNARSKAMAAFVDLLAVLVDKSVEAGGSVEDLPWLSLEVAYQCYQWVGQTGVEQDETASSFESPDDKMLLLPLASLRFLTQLCTSTTLARIKIEQPMFPEALHKMCGHAIASASNSLLFEGHLRYLCSLVECLLLDLTPLLHDVLPVLLHQALEMATMACDQRVQGQPGSAKRMDLSLRLFWLVAFAWRVQGLALDSSLKTLFAMLLSTLSKLGESQLTVKRTMLNVLGVLSAVVRLIVTNDKPDQGLSEAIVVATSQLMSFYVGNNSDSAGETVPVSVDWEMFAYRNWGSDTDGPQLLQLGIDSLLIAVLRRVTLDATMQRLWLQHDRGLKTLSAVGLPLSVRLLEFRASGHFISSTHKKCLVLLRNVISLATLLPHLRVVRVWRRAMRRASFIDSVALFIDGHDTSEGLQREALQILIALTTDSVVDATACARNCDASGRSLLTSVVSLAMRSQSPEITIACLHFFAAVAATGRPSALLVASALRGFVRAIESKAVRGSIEHDRILTAIFRCCRAISQHVPFDGATNLAVDAMSHLLSSTDPHTSASDISTTTDAVLLVNTLLIGEQITTEVLLGGAFPPPAFWHRMACVLKLTTDKSSRHAALRLCSRVMSFHRGGSDSHSVVTSVEECLLEILTVDDELGPALCVQWLRYQRLVELEGFFRSLCERLSKIVSLPEPQKKALMRVLPTLLSILDRSHLKFLLSEDAWTKIRDVALAWTTDPAHSDDGQYLALWAVKSLLRAKQLRVLHDAARSFRSACRLWHSRFVVLSTRMAVCTAREEATVSLGIHVLTRVSVALGFAIDQTTLQRRTVSLWLASSVYTEPRLVNVSSASLDVMARESLDEKSGVDASAMQLAHEYGDECMRSVIRIRAGGHAPRGDTSASERLATALLRAPDFRSAFLELLQRSDMDLVNAVCWMPYRNDFGIDTEMALACRLLTELSVEATIVSRLQKRHVHDQWIFQLTYASDRGEGFYSSETNHEFLSLAATVLRYQLSHDSSLLQYSVWKPMVLHCVRTMQSDSSHAPTARTLTLELLANLIQVNDALLTELWHVCLLLSSKDDLHDRTAAQGIILRALTDPLRDATTGEDRRRAAFIAYGLATSLRRATPLVHARILHDNTSGDTNYSLGEQLTHALFMSAGTRHRRTVRTAPTDWSSAASVFPLSLSFVAADTAIWVLRLLLKCLRDKAFTHSLADEFDLFDQLFAAVASSNVDVSSAAAWALRDAVLLQSTQRELARSSDYLGQRHYRRLVYFADLRVRDSELFTIAPRTMAAQALPSRFAVVELWILFYSRRMEELQNSPEALTHLEAVEEVALYLASQSFGQIFAGDDDVRDDDGGNTQLLGCAVRERHTALCEALLVIVCGEGQETRRVRVLAMELLTVLCAFETTKYPTDLFLDPSQLTKLLLAIENSQTESERLGVVKLVRELLGAPSIKLLFAGNASSELLHRVVSWLSEAHWIALRGAATVILKQLVTKSSAAYKQAVTNARSRKAQTAQLQSMLMVTARVLFESAVDDKSNDAVDEVNHGGSDSNERVDHVASMQIQLMPLSDQLRSTAEAAAIAVSVILHFFIRDQHGSCLRDFRYRGKVRPDRPLLRHEIQLEDAAAIITCKVAMLPMASKGSHPVVIQRLSLATRGPPWALEQMETLSKLPMDSADLMFTLSHQFSTVTTSSRGILGRLLVKPDVPAQVVSDSLAIITELGKSANIFMDKKLRLAHCLLAAMEASQRLGGRLDVSPLNSLTAWFWSNRSSVTHFRSSWEPLLALVQHMRSASFIQNPIPAAAASALPSTATAIGPTFLTTLMEWLATLESDSLTENCLNVLFFENGDVLVRLASYFYPQRSTSANFFYLVATVVRVNRLHCEIFARRHALASMASMLDDPTLAASAVSRAESLQFASRVVAKIVRIPTAAYKFLRHGGMTLFGKIAFAVFSDPHDETFVSLIAAAQNLVIASSFLCESVLNRAQTGSTGPTKTDFLALLTRRPAPASQTLSLVDALLLFLARQLSVSRAQQRNASPCNSSSSFERLAAVVLRSWIDKWPLSRGSFASVLFASADLAPSQLQARGLIDDFSRGMCRCIQLTRWDFYSELNTVARTFSAAISAGVRTGVIPLKCRNVFLPFDADFLDTQRRTLAKSPFDPLQHSREAAFAVPSDVVQELRDVLRFVVDHTNLAQTLSEHRKKTLTSRIKMAESSSRVAMGFHTVLVVVYDTLIDALEAAEVSGPSKMSRVDASRVILQWLTLLEEVGGLFCCSFNELDPAYYRGFIKDMRLRPEFDVPTLLLKMEGVEPREQTVAMLLNTGEKVLRTLTSSYELRGVTALGEGVAEHAQRLVQQYAQTKQEVSVAIALALSGRDAANRVQRGVIAAKYAWRRVFSSDETITSFMSGGQESETLWAKIRLYARAISAFLENPGPIIKARWLKLQTLIKSLGNLFDSSGQGKGQRTKSETETNPADPVGAWSRVSGVHDDSSIRDDDDGGGDGDDRQLGVTERNLAVLLGLDAALLLVSPAPFTSLESLLDHYGFASTGVKKQIALLNFEELKAQVLDAFARALGKDVATVAAMTAAKLENKLTKLHGQCRSGESVSTEKVSQELARLGSLLAELQGIVDAADFGIHLRVVIQRPVKQSMWQLLLAPVQRARVFTVYHALLQRRGLIQNSASQHGQLPLLNGIVTLQPTGPSPPTMSVLSTITETLTGGAVFIKSSVLEAISGAGRYPRQVGDDRQKNHRIAVVDENSVANDPFVLLATETVSRVVANVNSDDPLSDEKLVAALKRKLRQRRQQHQHESRAVLVCRWILPAKWRYAAPPAAIAKAMAQWRRLKRRVALILLLLAFWRQEELESDLTNPILARAFTTPTEREDYFVSTHLRKAFDEFIRVWMPESGSLGLPMWQTKAYGVGGTLVCVVLACIGPLVASADTSKRNNVMTILTYTLVGVTLLMCTTSIRSITKKHFVLQERNRLRLQPLGKFYPNAIALVTVLVEIVQLNSITFDPKFNWNDTDQLPKLLTWLGEVGISQIGIQQVELKAALCAMALIVWFLLLKCANKFQESNAFLNRVVTKDLPGVLNGTLYMGLVATFFAFLSCVDCDGPYGDMFEKCNATIPAPPPFLLSHQSVPCWTATHAPLALLGYWGVAFFLPIGLLSQGMNQVLFQQEVLDIKYAPVVLLFSQLVKAVAATARALFPFDTTLLASVALAGNLLLLVLVLRPNGVSLWYVQLVKAGIYAASGWSAACAIYRVQTKATSSVSNNIVYMGWLGIGALTVLAVQLWGWRREERENQELARHLTSQRLLVGSSTNDAHALTSVEHKFMRAAATAIGQPNSQARKLMDQAERFAAHDRDDDDEETVPADLRPLMRRARAFASGKQAAFGVTEAVFMQNARKRAKKLDPQTALGSVLRTRHADYKTD